MMKREILTAAYRSQLDAYGTKALWKRADGREEHVEGIFVQSAVDFQAQGKQASHFPQIEIDHTHSIFELESSEIFGEKEDLLVVDGQEFMIVHITPPAGFLSNLVLVEWTGKNKNWR